MKMPGSGLGFRVSGLSKPDYLNPISPIRQEPSILDLAVLCLS